MIYAFYIRTLTHIYTRTGAAAAAWRTYKSRLLCFRGGLHSSLMMGKDEQSPKILKIMPKKRKIYMGRETSRICWLFAIHQWTSASFFLLLYTTTGGIEKWERPELVESGWMNSISAIRLQWFGFYFIFFVFLLQSEIRDTCVSVSLYGRFSVKTNGWWARASSSSSFRNLCVCMRRANKGRARPLL
jgi:hypothetical protein